MRIGILTFGRDDLSYGLEIIRRECVANGHECYRATVKTARLFDALLFSVFWWEHLFCLADFLRKAGIAKKDTKRPLIIIGGFSTFNPVPLLCYADAVIVGDGEDETERVLSRDFSSCSVLCESKTSVKWKNVEHIKPICHETNGIARIELARGCKYRCKFCAVAHLKPYRECSLKDVVSCLRSTNEKRVSLFAPEPTMYSRTNDVDLECKLERKTRTDSDVRLDRLSKRTDSVPRVGIEGLSERLRKSINKPYSDDMIVDTVARAISEGRGGIFMYFILDLPGETEEDFDAFKHLLVRISEIKGADRFVLKPSPSVFMPTPHTPMSACAVHWDRDYRSKWADLFGRGDDRMWTVIMAERTRIFSPHSRLLQMMATRSGKEFLDVERELTKNKAISVSSGRPHVCDTSELERIFETRDLINQYCGERLKGPWDIVNVNKR